MAIALIHPPEASLDQGADTVREVGAPNVPQTIAQYEILAQPLAPVKDVPYVQQGFFTQVANLQQQSAFVNLIYQSRTPISNNPASPIKFFADYIIDNGPPVFPSNFFPPPLGFFGIEIPANTSAIFGIQYIYNPTPLVTDDKLGSTPQASASSRGIVTFTSSLAGQYAILSTVRQVFTTFDASLKPIGFSESAYAVPLLSIVNV